MIRHSQKRRTFTLASKKIRQQRLAVGSPRWRYPVTMEREVGDIVVALAHEQGASISYVLAELVREGLRRRGLMNEGAKGDGGPD